MLPLLTLIQQLNPGQKLWIKNKLVKSENANSDSIALFNSLLNRRKYDQSYPLIERPIYNCILELYGLKASAQRDRLLDNVFYSIYEKEYFNQKEKIAHLENLFHEMRRMKIEQESASLLLELNHLYKGSPLHAVYHHLSLLYSSIEVLNQKAAFQFDQLNKKLSLYLLNHRQSSLLREMIQDYKVIRSLYSKGENKTLEAYLLLSKLILVDICKQDQLLFESEYCLEGLRSKCKKVIDILPFGVERFFLKNIWSSIVLPHKKHLSSRLDAPNNFSFPFFSLNLNRNNQKYTSKEERLILSQFPETQTRSIRYKLLVNK